MNSIVLREWVGDCSHGSGRVCLGTWRFPSASGGLPPRLLPPSGGLG